MRNEDTSVWAFGIFCAILLASIVFLAFCFDAAAAEYRDARSLSDAHATVVRLTKQLREARHVEDATEHYSELYGPGVGRWVWLARQVGWEWTHIPRLMYIIDRESNGDPSATNPDSGAAGLLQFLPAWWDDGQFDPYSPRQNLRRGLRAFNSLNWSPWGM